MTEIKRAIKFHELLGMSTQKRVGAQLILGSNAGVMSHQGWDDRREQQYIVATARCILVVYDGKGAFALAMGEHVMAMWPSGSCECTTDDLVLGLLKDSLDARMKKSFCDTANSHFRALPDVYDEL